MSRNAAEPTHALWRGLPSVLLLAVAVLLLASPGAAHASRASGAEPAPVARADTGPPPPTAAQCAAVQPHRTVRPIIAGNKRGGGFRVFAMQFKQEPRNVLTYATFRRKVECALIDDVVAHRRRSRPSVVVFPEDVGLMTIGTGSRGARARDLLASKGCEAQGVPCSTLGALGAVGAAYARPQAFYAARFGGAPQVSDTFVAATDTFARGWMLTFSQLARRYGVYLAGSNDQAPFVASSAAGDIDALADPDEPRPAQVYVATARTAFNEAFLWGPKDVRADGPTMLRNVVSSNKKVPLTPIEEMLQLAPGPARGPAAIANVQPYALPRTRARLAFATSLPAFVYGDAGGDACADVSKTYMRCLDKLGANVVLQDEANPGRWSGGDGDGREKWQPLSWMTSTWRAASDSSVGFAYNVTPMMTGNLADLPFDGQSAITQRGLRGPGCFYVGNSTFVPGDDRADLTTTGGRQPEFLAMAPWVRDDASRTELRDTGSRLAPGSGDPLEGDYLETALVADLPFPPDPARGGCRSRPAPSPSP